MLEAAQTLAGGTIILLILAIAAWVNPLGGSQLRRLDGGATKVGNLHIAALLLLAAVGLSAVAAFLAIRGWFST
jgi:hypothetical protein